MTSPLPFHCIAAPSSPRNVRLMSVTDTSLQVSWWEPARANGLLQGYRVYFLNNNFTSVQTIRDNKSAMVETLTRLSEYIYYVIRINLVRFFFLGEFCYAVWLTGC